MSKEINNDFDWEICVDSVDSSILAEASGASRIELCSGLLEGGITPSFGLIKQVKQRCNQIKVFVLIRPRGGDFLYTENEFQTMLFDLEIAKNLGCNGIVSGVLLEDGTIDIERTKQLIQISKPLEFTFHRAFDMTRDLFESMETLIDLKVDRILTSGGESSVLEGLPCIKKLIKKADSRIQILPGGGINEKNIYRILKCGANQYHFSFRKKFDSKMIFRNSSCFMGGVLRPPEFQNSIFDQTKLQDIQTKLEC